MTKKEIIDLSENDQITRELFLTLKVGQSIYVNSFGKKVKMNIDKLTERPDGCYISCECARGGMSWRAVDLRKTNSDDNELRIHIWDEINNFVTNYSNRAEAIKYIKEIVNELK